jgi:hypothetical protein
MKEQKPISRVSSKIKRGEQYLYNGVTVWVEIQQSPSKVLICYQETRGLNDEYEQVSIRDLKDVRNPGKPIKSVVKPMSAEEKKFRSDLQTFFGSQILTMPQNCENCGKPLNAYNSLLRKACIAHILPKGKNNGNFRSVACHPANRMFLGPSCGCHNSWDQKGAEDRFKMPVYATAIERFNQFKHLLTGPELIKAYTYLNIKWQ